MRLPPLNPLVVFEAVGRHGNLTKAAGELCVTPGAASRQLQKLEECLGASLLVRSTRKCAFTPAGAQYWVAVNRALSDLSQCTERLVKSTEVRPLMVQCTPMFMRWLFDRLPRFYRQHPKINLSFMVGTSVKMADCISDCQIRVEGEIFSEFVQEFLFEAPKLAFCSKDYIEKNGNINTLSDFSEHTLLHSMTSESNWNNWLGEHAKYVLSRSKNIWFENGGLATQAAIEGLGMGLIREPNIRKEIDGGSLVVPFRDDSKTSESYFLMYSRRNVYPTGLKEFHRWLKSEAALSRESWAATRDPASRERRPASVAP